MDSFVNFCKQHDSTCHQWKQVFTPGIRPVSILVAGECRCGQVGPIGYRCGQVGPMFADGLSESIASTGGRLVSLWTMVPLFTGGLTELRYSQWVQVPT